MLKIVSELKNHVISAIKTIECLQAENETLRNDNASLIEQMQGWENPRACKPVMGAPYAVCFADGNIAIVRMCKEYASAAKYGTNTIRCWLRLPDLPVGEA